MLTQTLDELIQKLLKLSQQLKEMHEMKKHQQISYIELCNGGHPTRICLPLAEEVNFVDNQQQMRQYHNNNFQRGNYYNQGCRLKVGLSNTQQPY